MILIILIALHLQNLRVWEEAHYALVHDVLPWNMPLTLLLMVSIDTQKIQKQWLGCKLRLLSKLKEGLKIGSTAKSLKSKSA